ncbi:PREDICTED: monoacylglycerol lipase ABHD6-like [Gekko japonicus]|uniref:acylglycerol lipase n=1 Tax=Gekko japonicus TaxID=146911 RepID=A0ABM1KV79_GEKJA|nr:PREDICTED: monoacylglycerol lipase ABHD6-like [Gekko japonicus]
MDFILLELLLICIGILLIIFFTIYFLWPSVLLKFGIWYGRQRTGLQVRYAEHNGYRFSYVSCGKPGLQPSILMLHGLTLNKDMWLITLLFFPKNIHVVAVDMPGHGDTTCLPGDSYTASDQLKRLHQFVECIGLNRKPFHLVGISMGGLFAGLYAANYPSEVCGLSLLCPVGIRCPKETEVMKRLKELCTNRVTENIPFIPLNTQQGEEMLRSGTYNQIKLPKQVIKGVLDMRAPNNDFFLKYFFDMFSDESLYGLHDNMSKIKAPTQIIWGGNDQILDSSGAAILAAGIPHSQVHILEKCGHAIVLDLPKFSAQLLLDFHESFSCVKNKKLA